MGVTGWMEYTGAGIGYVGYDVDHVERIHKLDGCLAISLQSEGDNTAGAVWHILLGKRMILIALQTAIMNPSHALIVLQELCHLLCICTMLAHTEVETLKTEVEDERIHRGRDAAEIAHQLSYEFGGVTHLAESLHIGQTMVAVIRCAETWELISMSHPVEVAAVYNHATYL